MTSPLPPAEWYPDPAARHELRYWDGARWTDHVSDGGTTATDPIPVPGSEAGAGGGQVAQVQASTPERVTRQVQQQAGLAEPITGGGGTLLTEPVLVVNQKAKLIELTNEYAVYDQAGTQLGSVVQVGQNALRKVLRLLTSWDQFLPVRLEVRDAGGAPALRLTRPAKFFKSKVIVEGPAGGELGRIVQANMMGKIRFDFLVGESRIGGIQAENWRAWDFAVVDASGTEVARIKKTFEGLARTMFTTADNYVVRIHRPLEEPLRSLVVASALCVDTALKQDARGLG